MQNKKEAIDYIYMRIRSPESILKLNMKKLQVINTSLISRLNKAENQLVIYEFQNRQITIYR